MIKYSIEVLTWPIVLRAILGSFLIDCLIHTVIIAKNIFSIKSESENFMRTAMAVPSHNLNVIDQAQRIKTDEKNLQGNYDRIFFCWHSYGVVLHVVHASMNW